MMRSKKKLHINRDNKKYLGVCAGIADYLGVEAWSVRLLFLVSVLMGAWFLIPIYFVFYFCLDTTSGEFKDRMTQNTTFKHFKNVDYKKKLYRNTENARFLGVCAGIAEYFEIDVTVVRVVTFVLLFVAGPIPWLAYFAAYFILDKKPVFQPGSDSRQEAFHGKENMQEKFRQKNYASRREFKHCARKFGAVQDRLARVEAYVTSSQYKLHQEFKNI